jgi:hypothetical protein
VQVPTATSRANVRPTVRATEPAHAKKAAHLFGCGCRNYYFCRILGALIAEICTSETKADRVERGSRMNRHVCPRHGVCVAANEVLRERGFFNFFLAVLLLPHMLHALVLSPEGCICLFQV